ncbi:MAG: SDR family oxidoreductase [Hyphomicrobiales bacterium]|nr:SDR family oxidoreductase [Hyphomicrobiales bacterium]
MDLNLKGKRAIVTGASKGIGFSCAQALAAEGAEVLIVSRDGRRLSAAREKLGDRVRTFVADLSKVDEREKLAAAHPAPDILVNNAGAIPGGSIFDIDLARWQEAWSLKVFGYIHLTQLYMKGMTERRAGTIVNIIGLAGVSPRWDYVCGAAGNAALIAFTKALGGKSPDFGVRVVGINPASTRTDRIIELSKARARQKYGDDARWEEFLQGLPFNRAAEPEEIANLTAMLASDRLAYVSGTVIDVDGGVQYR